MNHHLLLIAQIKNIDYFLEMMKCYLLFIIKLLKSLYNFCLSYNNNSVRKQIQCDQNYFQKYSNLIEQ
jgi:hypothetical protein